MEGPAPAIYVRWCAPRFNGLTLLAYLNYIPRTPCRSTASRFTIAGPGVWPGRRSESTDTPPLENSMALNATEPPAQELLVHARERGANVAGVPSPTFNGA